MSDTSNPNTLGTGWRVKSAIVRALQDAQECPGETVTCSLPVTYNVFTRTKNDEGNADFVISFQKFKEGGKTRNGKSSGSRLGMMYVVFPESAVKEPQRLVDMEDLH